MQPALLGPEAAESSHFLLGGQVAPATGEWSQSQLFAAGTRWGRNRFADPDLLLLLLTSPSPGWDVDQLLISRAVLSYCHLKVNKQRLRGSQSPGPGLRWPHVSSPITPPRQGLPVSLRKTHCSSPCVGPALYLSINHSCPFGFIISRQFADSFNFNPHKWLLVNFDCSAMW